MKKIKSLFSVVILAAFTTSCTKEEQVSSNEVHNQNIMRFATEKELQSKIAEIETFKTNQENQILEKILKRNHVKAPTVNDLKNIEVLNANVKIDKNAILEDVKFYHQEKLKAISAERAHFGFTSIQSIADEINYTKVVNPEKAKQLINENLSLITYNNDFAKVVDNSKEVLVANVKGEYVINSKTLTLETKTSANANRLTGLTALKQGTLATNGFYAVTYHVGISTHKDDLGVTFYGNFTQYGSFINGALYPSWFYTTAGSSCTFSPSGIAVPIPQNYVPFISSAGDIVRNDVTLPNNLSGNSAYNWINTNMTNQVSGNYVAFIGGQFISITGSKNLNQ